jgi:hypothetical protein
MIKPTSITARQTSFLMAEPPLGFRLISIRSFFEAMWLSKLHRCQFSRENNSQRRCLPTELQISVWTSPGRAPLPEVRSKLAIVEGEKGALRNDETRKTE